jgi:hypothetical protein
MKNIFSYLISIYLIVRGFMSINEGRTWGWVMLIAGVGGIIFKIYEATRSPDEEWEDDSSNESNEN